MWLFFSYIPVVVFSEYTFGPIYTIDIQKRNIHKKINYSGINLPLAYLYKSTWVKMFTSFFLLCVIWLMKFWNLWAVTNYEGKNLINTFHILIHKVVHISICVEWIFYIYMKIVYDDEWCTRNIFSFVLYIYGTQVFLYYILCISDLNFWYKHAQAHTYHSRLNNTSFKILTKLTQFGKMLCLPIAVYYWFLVDKLMMKCTTI